jgi:hypothetical protein
MTKKQKRSSRSRMAKRMQSARRNTVRQALDPSLSGIGDLSTLFATMGTLAAVAARRASRSA